MPNSITIGICDDHCLFRRSLLSILTSFERIQVLYNAEHGKDLIAQLNTGVTPSIILLDLKMPVMDGYETTAWLKQKKPDIKIIAMSSFDGPYPVENVFAKGADAFISKNDAPEEVFTAIVDVYETGHHINKWSVYTPKKQTVVNSLTNKEKDVLKHLCSTKSYQEIADELYLSVRTVERHREEIFKKLTIKSRSNLITWAYENGLY